MAFAIPIFSEGIWRVPFSCLSFGNLGNFGTLFMKSPKNFTWNCQSKKILNRIWFVWVDHQEKIFEKLWKELCATFLSLRIKESPIFSISLPEIRLGFGESLSVVCLWEIWEMQCFACDWKCWKSSGLTILTPHKKMLWK